MSEINNNYYVFFDLDGTLVDSESVLYHAVDAMLNEHFPFKTEDSLPAKARLLGHPFGARAQQLFRELGFEEKPMEFQQFIEELKGACLQHVTRNPMRLMSGARDLCSRLKTAGLDLVICTGNDRKTFEMTSTRFPGFFADNFAEVVCVEPEMRAKPAPDVYLAALTRLQTDPQHVLCVFEDTRVGVSAARAANLRAVHVLDRRLDNSYHSYHGESDSSPCDHVIHSLEDFSLISDQIFRDFPEFGEKFV